MRMMRQGRAPGVQHQGGADARTQMLRIGGDRAQRLGSDIKQQSIHQLLVGIGQGTDPCWQGEDHVVILHGQEIVLARLEPALRGTALALGAMSVTARVVGDLRLRATRAARRVAAEGDAAALLNGRHDLQLSETQMAPFAVPPRRPVGAEDIRDLQA